MPRGIPKKKSTNGRRKKVAKQERRTARVTMEPETSTATPNLLQEALMSKLSLPPQQVRNSSDARSSVLSMCAHALVEMQTSIQVIAQAAVQAPNYTDTEERS